MEQQIDHDYLAQKAVSIESKNRVNHVDSGLPQWLIEIAFGCMLIQAAINYSPWLHWMEEHLPLLKAIVENFGMLVMYLGLLRGMKPLYRPFTVWWWAVIVLNIAGFVTTCLSSILYNVGLLVAVSLLLVYLPLGILLLISYRGRLRQVGVWMVLYILVSTLVPVLWYFLLSYNSFIADMLYEVLTIGVIVVYAWVLRRVLIIRSSFI